MLEKLMALDTALFLWINGFHSPVWDKIMWHVSGKLEWIPFYLLLLVFLIYRFRWKSLTILIILGLAITLADRISVIAFKETIQRLRPSHDPCIGHLVHIVNLYKGGAYGFISNHAANSFVLACFMSLIFKNKYLTLFLFAWAGLVSYSRIYLGVHYPGDILGGIILGSLIGWLMYRLYLKLIEYTIFHKKKGL
jgi:undecaprenyl-diphosphatase